MYKEIAEVLDKVQGAVLATLASRKGFGKTRVFLQN
jgi:hypothetical protein